MSTFITLGDGRSWLERDWVYDAILRAVARELPNNDEGRALAAWLLEQQCFEQGPGIGYLDLRELTPTNQRLIIECLRLALGRARSEGPLGWNDPSAFSAWLRSFDFLLRLVESVEHGEPPEALSDPNVNGLMPPTGERHGPGW